MSIKLNDIMKIKYAYIKFKYWIYVYIYIHVYYNTYNILIISYHLHISWIKNKLKIFSVLYSNYTYIY